MMRCHSVSVRRSCCGPADAVAVGDVDMGLILSLEGLYQPPQSGRQALEVELEPELHDARLMDLGDLSERTTLAGQTIDEVRINRLEVRVVEDVERFEAKL